MNIVHVMEGLAGLFIILVVITQIIIPGFKNTKFFPMFRRKRRDLETAVVDHLEDKDLQQLREVVESSKVEVMVPPVVVTKKPKSRAKQTGEVK